MIGWTVCQNSINIISCTAKSAHRERCWKYHNCKSKAIILMYQIDISYSEHDVHWLVCSYYFNVKVMITWIIWTTWTSWTVKRTVYPKKYAHGFVVLCFVVVMQSFIMNSHEVFIHIHQGCFAGTGAIVRLPQCQWSKPAGYGKISHCITTTKHSKAKTVCIFLGIYCNHSLTVFTL